MRRNIRLTERQLNRVIKESVRRTLRESEESNDVWDLLEQMKGCMSCEDILDRLIARTPNAYATLQDIFNVECGDNFDNEEDEEWY